MIKIGNTYFREDQIAAIRAEPEIDRIHVFLLSGQVVVEDADVDLLCGMLIDAGLFFTGDAVEVLAFAPSENLELRKAYDDGYLFAAKDKSGQVYAYKKKPEKGAGEWFGSTEEDYVSRRLHGDFECLSFEDDAPLDLVALFSGASTEEADDV